MAETEIDGLITRYEVTGAGPPLLMFSPGGFDAELDNWSTHGIYRSTGMFDHLRRRHTCIRFDKRESGGSGGRVEPLTWRAYAAQGKGLADQLGFDRVHLIGGCVGASVAATFAVEHPERVAGMVLYSPAGGARYRILQHARLAEHRDYVTEHGLTEVVELARRSDIGFAKDPRVGLWANVIRGDPVFAEQYAQLDQVGYLGTVEAIARVLFDRDTAPGPEPEAMLALDVPTLVVPGGDPSHATSAARYFHECLPGSEYWDVPVAEQTEQTAPARVLDFLAAH